jgi:hypothetical protein
MARSIADIEAEIRALQRPEQERLLRALLEELDGPADTDVDRMWLEECSAGARISMQEEFSLCPRMTCLSACVRA